MLPLPHHQTMMAVLHTKQSYFHNRTDDIMPNPSSNCGLATQQIDFGDLRSLICKERCTNQRLSRLGLKSGANNRCTLVIVTIDSFGGPKNRWKQWRCASLLTPVAEALAFGTYPHPAPAPLSPLPSQPGHTVMRWILAGTLDHRARTLETMQSPPAWLSVVCGNVVGNLNVSTGRIHRDAQVGEGGGNRVPTGVG